MLQNLFFLLLLMINIWHFLISFFFIYELKFFVNHVICAKYPLALSMTNFHGGTDPPTLRGSNLRHCLRSPNPVPLIFTLLKVNFHVTNFFFKGSESSSTYIYLAQGKFSCCKIHFFNGFGPSSTHIYLA